ncbi:MAG: RNA pseudouridine synthase [Clostridiales bacterium]|nr:MAG: RNA pseudouridine synthase [Clostridiales bacterium]
MFYIKKILYYRRKKLIKRGCAELKEIIVQEDERDQRIDRFLLKLFKNTTRGNIYKLLRKKVIKLNGRKAKPEEFIKEGDSIQIFLAEETLNSFVIKEKKIDAVSSGLDIVYEDENILVLNKPRGLLTHPDSKEYANTLSSKVIVYLEECCSRTFKPAPVQRLDKNTSGIVLFGKTYDAMKKYNALMRKRAFRKYYLAVVEGEIPSSGEVVGYLEKDNSKNRVALTSDRRNPDAKKVHTKYKPLKGFEGYTLMEIELLTGRAHQIRVSMASIGHPIVGDTKYGGSKKYGVSTQLLHAYKMIVEDQTFECENKELDSFIKKLEKKKGNK